VAVLLSVAESRLNASILIIEAESETRSQMLSHFSEGNIRATGAADRKQALEKLAGSRFDLVVTDLPRPAGSDKSKATPSASPETPVDEVVPPGTAASPSDQAALHTALAIEWVEQIRKLTPRTPIVLTTQQDTEPAACEALLRGAASYVPKHLAASTLRETVQQVLKVSQSAREATEVDDCMSRVKLELTLPSHEALVPGVIAKLEAATRQLGLFDEMVWTQIAMALDEAILNAMIHGNLEVESKLREIDEGKAYCRKIEERRHEAPYMHRRTEVILTATRSQAVFVVRDQGPGFDVNSLPDPTDPANLESIGGRGLLLIGAFMDEIHHNEVGNELTMIKRKAAESPLQDPDEPEGGPTSDGQATAGTDRAGEAY